MLLWFDVGNGRYTTKIKVRLYTNMLWFDVGNGRYTTIKLYGLSSKLVVV